MEKAKESDLSPEDLKRHRDFEEELRILCDKYNVDDLIIGVSFIDSMSAYTETRSDLRFILGVATYLMNCASRTVQDMYARMDVLSKFATGEVDFGAVMQGFTEILKKEKGTLH